MKLEDVDKVIALRDRRTELVDRWIYLSRINYGGDPPKLYEPQEVVISRGALGIKVPLTASLVAIMRETYDKQLYEIDMELRGLGVEID